MRRYVEQKAAYIQRECPGSRHILIVPGETTSRTENGQSVVYTIASPLISKTSRYRALTKLHLVEEALERERPDIIESGDPYQVAWKAIASGRGLGIPIVGFYHSHFPEAYIRSVAKYFGDVAVSLADDICRRYVKALYNHFERTFVPSPVLTRTLNEWGVERAVTVDLGVDADVFRTEPDDRAATRERLRIPADIRLLIYVGRLAAEKNVRTLLEAFEILHERTPGTYHLLCVGDGVQRASVAALCEATGAVTWTPYCADPLGLASLYRAADVFVHPGVQETFGLVTLESQASGTPVVGIRGSYMDRIIFTNQDHWARENSPAALADAVAAFFDRDCRDARRMASEEARGRYSWNAVFARLFEIYAEVIAQFRS
ncbi:MAG: glycosyltransferase [Terrimicrobiaceae bacterium]|nr:glycosyltransferase [Terrimicrobiaceae bacterium]